MRVTAVVGEESRPFELEDLVVEGDSVPEIFIPRLVDLYSQGRFPFDRLVRYYSLVAINQAAEDAEKGEISSPCFAWSKIGFVW